jgi:glycosyltransferase involved in cell wall biosynthesis
MGDFKIEAAHYRTWQFIEPLIMDGHQVCLCAGAPNEFLENPPIPDAWQSQLTYIPISLGQGNWRKMLQAAHDSFQPDCVVAVNYSHCLFTTKLKTDKPIWMDIYGDMLTILQAASYRAESDRGIITTIGFMQDILQAGDAYSGCGEPQKHAMVGELAMSGRLNGQTFGFEFAHSILPGAPTPEITAVKLPERDFLKEHGIGDEDFVLLWCGGYNTWTDVHTLFAALEWAMAQDSTIHYLSVGASTYGESETVYDQFQELIANSDFPDRYHLMGWQPWSSISQYYRASDAGLNIDALHYETIYGTRTRLVEMMASGLPVITSLGCELSYFLQTKRAGLTFEVEDWQTLGEHILSLAQNEGDRARLAEKALNCARNDLSFCTTTLPLRNWVKEPIMAPDRKNDGLNEWIKQLEFRTRALIRRTLWKIADKEK